MSNYKDEHLILSCYEYLPLKKLRDKIIKKIVKLKDNYDIADYSEYIQPVSKCIANSLHVLFIPADGSKEGWETSNMMDEVREYINDEIQEWNANGKDKIYGLLVTDDDYNGLSVERFVNSRYEESEDDDT